MSDMPLPLLLGGVIFVLVSLYTAALLLRRR